MMRSGGRYQPFERIDYAKTTRRNEGYTDSHGQGIFQFIRNRKGGAKPESSSGSQNEIISHKIFGNLPYVSPQPYHLISP